MMGIEPVTRKEMFMAAAAGDSVTAPTPVTREEYFLSKIAGSGGGGGGSRGGGLFKVTITGTANESGDGYTYMSDKTGEEVYDAFMNGMLPYAELIVDGEIYFTFVPCMISSDQYSSEFIGVTASSNINNEGKILVSIFSIMLDSTHVTYRAHVLNSFTEINCGPFSTLFA